MPLDRIVVNSSPLICLFKSGLEELIPSLFADIVVPEQVLKEVTAGERTGFAGKVLSRKWIKPQPWPVIDLNVAAWDLGAGESSVLSFALHNPAYSAVIDDRMARRCASSLHCKYIGTVGILVLAKRRGIISSLGGNIAKLRDSGLWLSESFVAEIMRRENE